MNHEPTDQHEMDAALHEAAAFEEKAYRRRWLVVALGFPLVGVFLLFAAVTSTRLKHEIDTLSVDLEKKKGELGTVQAATESLSAEVTKLNGEKLTATTQRDAARLAAETEKGKVDALTMQSMDLTMQVAMAKTSLDDVEKKLAAKQAVTEQAVAVSKETVQRTINLLSPLIGQLRSGTNITLARFTEIRKQAGADEEALKKLDEIVRLLRQVDSDPANLDSVKALLAEIKRPDDAPARTAADPPPPNSGKSVQFLFNQNDDSPDGRQQKLAQANTFATGLGYAIEKGRTDIVHSPATTEVRYYHHPDDRPAAEIFLKALQARFKFSSGRVSYVIDQEQPPGTLQVSFAAGALGPSSKPLDWATQVGFGSDYATDNLATVTDRLADIQKVFPRRDLKAMKVTQAGKFYLLLGCSLETDGADALFAELVENRDKILVEFNKRPGLHWAVPKLRVIQISAEFGILSRGSDGIYRAR